ncbi:hypothetical protein J23TS9_15180 [Paenibacillus sp. J23TS9]|nr:hypothetical protein J23TS9_15180 [Paenibacillus sp. J23TS9]
MTELGESPLLSPLYVGCGYDTNPEAAFYAYLIYTHPDPRQSRFCPLEILGDLGLAPGIDPYSFS